MWLSKSFESKNDEHKKERIKGFHIKDPHAIPAPQRYQKAHSIFIPLNHTINTINSNTYHLLEKVTKIHKRQVYNPKNE
jgi:hypothetical protein